jgi:hypothetical protein
MLAVLIVFLLQYGFNTDIPHMESNLDTQTLTGVAQGVPTDFWLNKGIASFDVLDWLLGVGNLTAPPLVDSLLALPLRTIDSPANRSGA